MPPLLRIALPLLLCLSRLQSATVEFDRIGTGGTLVNGQRGGLFWDPGGLPNDWNDFGSAWVQQGAEPARPVKAAFAIFPNNAASGMLYAGISRCRWQLWRSRERFSASPNAPELDAEVPVSITALGTTLTGSQSYLAEMDLTGIKTLFLPGQRYLMSLEIQGVSSRAQLSTAVFDGCDDWVASGNNSGFQQGPATVFQLLASHRQFGARLEVETVPGKAIPATLSLRHQASSAVLAWTGATGRAYRVYQSASLLSWEPAGGFLTGNAGMEWTQPVTGPRMFFTVKEFTP